MALTKVPSNLDSVTATTQSQGDNSTNVATTAYVDTGLNNLIDSAPGNLNTLNELAAAMNDNASFFSTVLPLSGGTMTGNISHASDFTLDMGGDIILDADGGTIILKDGGTEKALISLDNSGYFDIYSSVQDSDIRLRGNNGGSLIDALVLDMSEGGRATFNEDVVASGIYVGARNASFDLYNNGTTYLNGTAYVDDVLLITGSSAEIRIGDGLRIDDDGTTNAGRIGLNRNPSDGAYLSSSSYQRYQINGPGSSGDYLDIQNYSNSGSYHGSLRMSGGNLYMTGSNDKRIKLSDSGISGISDSNNTVHVRGDNDSLKLNAAGNGHIIFEENGSERMRIRTGGDVGINMDPAGYGKLSVNGTGVLLALRASSGGGRLGFYEGGAGRFYLDSLDGSDGLKFVDGDGSSERMRINTDGTLLINTTVTSTSSSNHDFLRIGANFGYNQAASWNMIGYDDFGTLYCDTGGTGVFGKLGQNAAVLSSGMYNYTSASGKPIYFYVDGSYRCMISSSSSGTLGSSDIKWKEDVEDINYGLDTVKSLQPRKFKWKNTGKESIGFIAQEMETVISEVVEDAPGDGAEGQENPGKSLDYAALTSVLTKAIQELSAELDAAKDRIATLEG